MTGTTKATTVPKFLAAPDHLAARLKFSLLPRAASLPCTDKCARTNVMPPPAAITKMARMSSGNTKFTMKQTRPHTMHTMSVLTPPRVASTFGTTRTPRFTAKTMPRI